MTHWSEGLRKLNACYEAHAWAQGQPSPEVAWKKCERADWMLWLLGRTDTSAPWSKERKPLVRCALACASEGLRYAPEGDAKDAAEACISITQAWCEGAASREDCEEARAAAYADAAYATAYATDAAAAAAAAYAAAAAAAAAAAYAADAAAAADARTRVLRELCDIVRGHYPNPPKLEG